MIAEAYSADGLNEHNVFARMSECLISFPYSDELQLTTCMAGRGEAQRHHGTRALQHQIRTGRRTMPSCLVIPLSTPKSNYHARNQLDGMPDFGTLVLYPNLIARLCQSNFLAVTF